LEHERFETISQQITKLRELMVGPEWIGWLRPDSSGHSPAGTKYFKFVFAEDSALLDAGLDFAVSERIAAGVSYSGRFSDNLTDNAVKGRSTMD
jgi:hypothetical protein